MMLDNYIVRAMIDNDVIITIENPRTWKMWVKPAPAVLIRATQLVSPYARLRVVREARNGNRAVDQVSINSAYIKIRMLPYETIQLEITDWSRHTTPFHFKLVSGNHNELLFRDLAETLTCYQTHTDESNKEFTIGSPKGSGISVVKENKRYVCRFHINNHRLTLCNNFQFKESTDLSLITESIFTSIKSIQQPPPSHDSDFYVKQRSLDELILRHFKPTVY